MENIDVRGVPESFAKAIAAMVEYLRRETMQPPQTKPVRQAKLSVKRGKVLGSLRRKDLYDDRI